jgi:hypothetical protein
VPDTPTIPTDLADLQRRRIDAETAVAEHITEVDRHRAEQYPEPSQAQERARWSSDEATELARLRGERDQLGREVRQHPVMVQARETGVFWPTWEALQEAVRQLAA